LFAISLEPIAGEAFRPVLNYSFAVRAEVVAAAFAISALYRRASGGRRGATPTDPGTSAAHVVFHVIAGFSIVVFGGMELAAYGSAFRLPAIALLPWELGLAALVPFVFLVPAVRDRNRALLEVSVLAFVGSGLHLAFYALPNLTWRADRIP